MAIASSKLPLLLCAAMAFACGVLFWDSLHVQYRQRVRTQVPPGEASDVGCPPPQVVISNEKQQTSQDEQPVDKIDNSGAAEYLKEYEEKFFEKDKPPQVSADPNNPDTITQWWQAAAMIDWITHAPLRYNCQNQTKFGNWYACQDEPYVIKPPCLVYSFGINYDFTFDDAMAKLGCEVHSFDPSMGWPDKKRGDRSMFYNLGIGAYNTDGFIPRKDIYVQKRQVWKMRTLKSVVKMLGHENRVIDVLKIDVESSEWDIVDNMMEADMFQFIRQFDLEYHLFTDQPARETYVYLFKTLTRLREMGFREFFHSTWGRRIDNATFNNQADTGYVNARFKRQAHWR